MKKFITHNLNVYILSLVILSGAFFSGCQTVNAVDIERYMGVWYEIAKYPVIFENGLVGVTAEYTLLDDGRVRVKNQGFKGSFSGELSSITGYATNPDPNEPAKLKVKFDPFPVNLFRANYWIIELDANYEYAVISNPSRSVLWILSKLN